MTWQLTPSAIPTVVSTVLTLALVGYAAREVRSRDAGPTPVLFLGIAVAAAVWTGFSALKLLHTEPAMKLLFYRALHVGAAAVPPLFFLFALAYTDRDQWIRPDVVAAVFAVPIVFVGLLVVSPGDSVIRGAEVLEAEFVVVRVEDGPAYVLFVVYSMLLALGTLALLVTEAVRVGPSYYPQAGLLVAGTTAPMIVAGLTTARVPPFDAGVNLVPVSVAVTPVAFGIAMFRYRLFDLPPLAYTTAMKYSPDGMLVLDANDRIVHANPSGETLIEAFGGGIGDRITAIVPEFDPESETETVSETTLTSGETRFFRVTAERLTRGSRDVGWAVVLRDITEEQRQTRSLERQTAQLDAFASTVSHDLRNPLSVAIGFTEVAREGVCSDAQGQVSATADSPETATVEDAFDRVEAAHERMDEIISGLLSLSKAGERIDTPETVSISAVVADAWENVDTRSGHIATDIDRSITADKRMLQHVFENLFRNAIEHGGDDVRIRVVTLADGFFVEDNGPGIPESQRASVFKPGFTTNENGTGYGLQIVHSITDAHGWDLSVTAGSDGGARFEVTGVD